MNSQEANTVKCTFILLWYCKGRKDIVTIKVYNCIYLSCYPSNTTLVCKDKGTQRWALCIAVHPIQNNNICDSISIDTSRSIAQALPYITLIKNHMPGHLYLTYVCYHRIVSLKENKLEIIPSHGWKTKVVHISHVIYILPAENIISEMPDYHQFGRDTKLWLNPDHIPDLSWQLASSVNTSFSSDVQMFVKSQMIPTCTIISTTLFLRLHFP